MKCNAHFPPVRGGFAAFLSPCLSERLRRGPLDPLTTKCAELLLKTGATRERLSAGLYLGEADGDDVYRGWNGIYWLTQGSRCPKKKLP